jgi:tetratricopeptide (TPR) repeat protein
VGRAVDVFRDLITDFPDFHLALNYLGYMWAEQGANLEEAQSLVERAVSLDPGNGAYADSLGWVYYQRGEYEKALEHLRRAADVLPSDGTVQEHLGDVHLALGDPAAARDAYESALALGDVDREGELERKLKAVERLLRGQEP